MATCIESIGSTPIGSIQELQPSTLTPFAVSTVMNKLFRFQTEANTTARFNINLTPQVGSTIRCSLSIYRMDGTTPVLIGTVTLGDPNTIFSRDFPPAQYIICIRSVLGTYTGNIVSTYTNFPITQRFQPVMYHGQSMVVTELVVEAPANPCDEPIYFRILEGELPPGIDLTLNGMLEGQLPNLDCIDETADLPPSVNWLYMDTSGAYQPWGLRWKFKVRAYLANFPAIYIDEWFCIQIHNNWDFDRDNFLEQAPFDRVRTIEIIQEPTRLPENICCVPHESDPDTVVFVPQKIEPPKCIPCDEEATSMVTLVPIPPIFRETPVSEIAKWYNEHRNTVFNNSALDNFADSLKKTKAWQAYMENLALDGSDTTSDGRNITVSSRNGDLEIMVSSNLDDTHFDVILEKLRTLQNQKLPMTFEGHHGESMTIELGTKIS